MTITSVNIQEGTFTERRCRPRLSKRYIIGLLTIVILILIFGIYMLTKSIPKGKIVINEERNLTPPNPEIPPGPSSSVMRNYSSAAVSSDSQICSDIGKDILQKEGSAVDATIATMICNGLVTMQSMGIGGGFLMTIYSNEQNKMFTLNAREAAPMKATENMFGKDPNKSKVGPLAIGVPGELKGYIEAHKKFGKLPWATLVQPTIDLCKKGFNISNHQSNALKYKAVEIKNDSTLSNLFLDENGSIKPEGEKIIHSKFCQTLEIIADKKNDFYDGSLADNLVGDIQSMGGIITKEDLLNYTARWEDPIEIELEDDIFYTVPAPGGGLLLGYILNILKYYEFKPEDMNGVQNSVKTYHRIIEAFKFAFAKRSLLGDQHFVDIKKLIANLTDEEIAEEINKQILDNTTFNDPKHYGAVGIQKDDHGTAHISVLAPNGDAVSVTSTINLYFGSGVVSNSTGIILNSGMDDFSSSEFDNYFGLPFSSANKIEPMKRPFTSMAPSIILDKHKNVKMVVGAAGGTKIPTAIALVIMRCLWFNQTLKEAIDAPRLHHQVFPMDVSYEFGFTEAVIEGLEKLKHTMTRSRSTGSVINAILKDDVKEVIYANADYRKRGETEGF